MSVWLFRSCLSPASRFRSSRTEAAHSFRSVSRSVSFNRSPCVASLRDPNPYTFERTATNGSSTRIPSTKESRRQVGAGVAERGTRPGAAGANRLDASSCRGHARYQRARAESIGAVAQWERITLAVWGSRVRIPPAPGGETADTMPSIGVVPRRSFVPLGWKALFISTKGGRMTSELDKRIDRYTPAAIEEKWRERWASSGLHNTPDVSDKPNFYFLTMFPYPSGEIHVGHWYAFAPPDAAARFLRMRGHNVLFPMGFDAFGINAENAAIDRGMHPAVWTEKNMAHMREQFNRMGAAIDWRREVVTCYPEYYRWNQWMFLKLYEKGLAYRADAPVNWCPRVAKIAAPAKRSEVERYAETARTMAEIGCTSTERDKTGVDTGAFARNVFTGERIPIWIADYVLSTYGPGAIMAVPGHDERDFAFAKKYGLEIREVISPDGQQPDRLDAAYIAAGTM